MKYTEELISIIIPVYNAMPYLVDCLKSISKQNYSNLEIIFIDDGSTDDSYSYLSNMAQSDSRIKIIQQTNQGPSTARNRGLSEANGKWIAFVDADDIIKEDYIRYLYNIAKDNECLISSCGYETQTAQGEIIAGDNLIDKLTILKTGNNIKYNIPYTVWHMLISSELIKKNKIKFDEQITYLEDVLFVYNVLFCAGKYINGSEIKYRRIDHADSLTNVRYKRENFDKWLSSLEARYKICILTKEYPALFANAVYELSFFCEELKILYKDILKNDKMKQKLIQYYINYCKKSLSDISIKYIKRKIMISLCVYTPNIFFKLKGTTC